MAQIVNVRRDVDDKFYRYRMPLLMTKIEGKGNGIKTVIPNMSDVARALSRPPTYPTKFFGCELGAQTTFDEKNDRYIVNGAHDAARMRELLDVFIDKFVLCASCKNPETELVITPKTEDIIRDCKACGQRTGVDMRHKLTTFIIKNPPKKQKSKKEKKAKAAGEEGGEEGGSPTPGEDAAADEGAESDDELTRRIKAEAADLNAESQLGKDEWSVDTSEAAVRARTKALEGAMGGLAVADEDDEDDENSPYAQLGRWATENRDEGPVGVFKKMEELGIEKKHRSVQVLVQALFTENIVKEVERYAPLFLKINTGEKHHKALLGGIERFVAVSHPDLMNALPKILMAFYQADILDEEVLKHWSTHTSKKYVDKETSKKVRKAAEPFMKWLEEADDDESDEE